MGRRLPLGGAVAAAIALLAVAPASAAVTCEFDAAAETLAINMGADNDQAIVRVNSGTIEVLGIPACTNGNATTTTIDDINVFDNSADGDTRIEIRDPATFQPGSVIEEGSATLSEIEFNIVLGGGTADRIDVAGSPASEVWRFGNSGLNANVGAGADDVEVVAVGQPDAWSLAGGGEVDNISAQGGNGAGAAYTGSARLRIQGDDGDDVLRGGDSTAGDELEGLRGSDTVLGFAGDDSVGGAPDGTNSLDGGAGVDTASYVNGNTATVDVGIAGPQDTGAGTDTLASLENIRGSDSSDTLTGDAGANRIDGRDGIDTIDGRAGNDVIADTADGATVTYARASAGVVANLTTGTATGGAGNDTLSGVTNLIGSPFADTLTGDAVANTITPLAGTDTVSALGGADSVDVRDGAADTASCGTAQDTAIADQATLDTVDADCETTSFLPDPDPDPEPPPGGGGNPPADTEVTFELSAKGKQRVLKRKAVVVSASCPLENCDVSFAGKVKPRAEELAAGDPEKLTLKLVRTKLRGIAKALRAGKKPKVAVKAVATDGAGNEAAQTLKVKAKR
jgi:Ca2+-binding RTX toxin-like protein